MSAKSEGGLGIRRAQHINAVKMAKSRSKLLIDENIWVQITKSTYLKPGDFSGAKRAKPLSNMETYPGPKNVIM